MSSVSQPQPAHVNQQGYTAESMEMSQPKAHQPMGTLIDDLMKTQF